jgi:glycosyltransferase involved in cell wall biosynthesis
LKVSIIITVFNRVHFLKKALLSLKNESLMADEIIISDDGSQEAITLAIQGIVDEMKCKVKFTSQEHKGFRLARCRNNGARVASGEYLIFIDQDIVLTENFIETFINHKNERQFCVAYPIRLTVKQTDLLNDSIIASFNFKPMLEKKQIQKIKKQYIKDNFYRLLKRFRVREIGPKLRGGVAAINREDYIQVNGYDEN